MRFEWYAGFLSRCGRAGNSVSKPLREVCHAYCLFAAACHGHVHGLLVGDAKPISLAEAIKQIGKPQVLVEMHVRSVKYRIEKRGIIYLDSAEDFTSPNNLGVAISAEAAEKFKTNGMPDPAKHFMGKTIHVRGCIMRFEERPYLPVHSPEQIVMIDKP
jgi:hypothetical protein